MSTTIKAGDLFVVQREADQEVCNYTGQQFLDDINLTLAERDVKVWVQDTPPPTPLPPDYASQKDLWYDTSIGAFFIGALDQSGTDVIWIIVNPTDHRNFLDAASGEVSFPQGVAHGQTFEHPNGVTYHFKASKNQWMDKDLPGLDTFVLREGDTMTGALQLSSLVVVHDDSVEAHIELNKGLLTADDSVVGEEQRLYWNGDTVAKHEDVVTLTNSVINIDQHIENITPYAYRGLLRNSTVEEAEAYVLYDGSDDVTSDVTKAEKVFLSDTGVGIDGIDATEITNGMFIEIQAVSGTDLLTGKVTEKSNVTGGAKFTLDVTRSQGNATVGDISHVRIFSVADSSAKAGVFYQKNSPDPAVEVLKEGQLWVDSKTNLQYIWTGEEWAEVGAACGGGSSNEIPVGVIWPYAGNINKGDNDPDTDPPIGWFLCDGTSFDGEKYPLLKAVMGGSTSVPNLKGRYLGGAGEPTGTGSNSTHQYGLKKPRSTQNDYTRKPRANAWNSNNTNPINSKEYNYGGHSHNITANGNASGGSHHHSWSGYKSNNGGSGKNHSEANKPFTVASNESSWSKFERTDNDTWLGGGNHNHNVTVNGSTNTNTGGSFKHSHTIEYASFDSYTRPFTYVVNWIIKHD